MSATATSLTPRHEKALETLDWYHADLGFTWDEVAEAAGASVRTLQRWREQESAPSRDKLHGIERLDELRFWIDQVFSAPDYGMREAQEWMHTRLEELRGKTPFEVVQAGNVERLIEMLATVQTGAFG